MESDFQTVLKKIVKQLNEQSIPYCLIGGLAATLRGRMRTTEDVDLIIATDAEEAISFFHALPADTFGPLFPEVEQVARKSCILALEHLETQITLNLAIGISGFERQVVSRSEGLSIARQLEEAVAEDLVERIRSLRR